MHACTHTCTNTNTNLLCKVSVVLINLISSDGATPVHAAVDTSGSYLAVANYDGGSISIISTFVGAQVC
jgi:DNA-binding beta-propeller fold protein YncE